MSTAPPLPAKPDARAKLLDAAVAIIRAQGFSATSVDDLCRAAGVTKGAFFHHFASKDDLAIAAARHWSETTGAMFAAAAYHDELTPLERVLAYVDLRAALIDGPPEAFSCLAGTLVQETFATKPAVRDACGASICGHARTLVDDIAAAMRASGRAFEFDAESVAFHTQAVLQGGFILAKAANDPQVARDSVAHLRRYLHAILSRPNAPAQERP